MYPHLIILYGRFQKEQNWKQQRMIDGGSTCMYREFAEKFGTIIYLAPQDCSSGYDESICDLGTLLQYLKQYPNSIVWSVKHDPKKDEVLKQIPNKKFYYSCCAHNTINQACDISLVDRYDRLKDNAKMWVKGKSPDYWTPEKNKVYDFVIVGHRGDKNELFFLLEMCGVGQVCSILWIGGEKFKNKIDTHHEVYYTPFLSMEAVSYCIQLAKIGIILSEHPSEGFPQTFLEMTMSGVPVIYLSNNDQENRVYQKNYIKIKNKKQIALAAAHVLYEWTQEISDETRKRAIENYSLEKSYESILEGLGVVWK